MIERPVRRSGLDQGPHDFRNLAAEKGSAMLKKLGIWPFALVLAFLAYAAVGVADEAPTKKTISIATLAPPGSTWMKVFEAWNREIRRRSNKTLELRFYPGGVQGD